MSTYWGLGGARLADTVGGTLEQQGSAGNGLVVFVLWAAVVLKLVAAALPLLVLGQRIRPAWMPTAWVLVAWIEAGILTVYGLVLTTAGLLVQADVIHASVTADHRALAWHAYLCDPWFLIWGLLVTVALRRGRRSGIPVVADSSVSRSRAARRVAPSRQLPTPRHSQGRTPRTER